MSLRVAVSTKADARLRCWMQVRQARGADQSANWPQRIAESKILESRSTRKWRVSMVAATCPLLSGVYFVPDLRSHYSRRS